MSAARQTPTSEPQFVQVPNGILAILRAPSVSASVLFQLPIHTSGQTFATQVKAALPLLKGARGTELVLIGDHAHTFAIEQFLKGKFPVKIKCVVRDGPFSAYYFADGGKLRLEKSASEKAPRRRKVLIVDDSVTIRKLLHQIFSQDPELEVVAEAGLPSEVEGLIKKHRPDVITLDIGLPEMNGVELLRRYLPNYPIPTVMISALSQSESPLVLQSLESGAVDYIQKPVHHQLREMAPMILEKVKSASHARVRRSRVRSKNNQVHNLNEEGLIAIGASTGGTEAICDVLSNLPKNVPPIVITQHIPPIFSAAFAQRLNDYCSFEVREAKDGDILTPGLALVAPGGLQMGIVKYKSGWRVVIKDAPPVNRHRPSVDYLFDSVAAEAGSKAIGIILTGMGADGAKGLAKMRQAGSLTIGQDEATCVVYGMPRMAMKENAVEEQLPLEDIAPRLIAKLSIK